MKKVISLFLSLAMLLSIVSVVDFSAFADVQTGSCGDNVTYSLDTETGVLTISGTGKMTDYSAEDCPFNNRAYIKSVIIENGVISIGNYAFSYFGSLTNVTIPNSVTSIGYDAFNYCESLASITIPNSVTSIGSSAFFDCTSLKSIEVLDNNKNYSSADGVLFNKDKSELITYPAGKTDSEYAIPNSVTSIGYDAFNCCRSLASVTIPNSVTSIGDYAFDNCESLTSVTIPNSVTNIGENAFENCESLASVTIPESVTSIGRSAFSTCKSLISVTIPNSVTSISYGTFSYCTSLKSVTIPNSVTNIGDYAFSDLENLKDVYYNGSKEEWNKIIIEDGNDGLTNATIHCTDGVINEKPIPPESKPTPAPQPSTQPTQETPQQVAQQTAQQPLTQNNTTAAQTEVAKPKSVSPKTVKAAKKAVSVEWKKVGGVKGYQVQVATDKKSKKNKKTVTIKKQKTTKTTVKKLKAKKKYYVRVRTYKIVNGKKVYSAWSKVKSVKTK